MSIVDDQHPQYQLPKDFDATMYKTIYKDLRHLSVSECKQHYLNNGIREKRVYSLKDIPADFIWEIYTELNQDLKGMTEMDAKIHYQLHGRLENRIYTITNIPKNFVWKDYVELNSDLLYKTEVEAKAHYELHGRHEHRIYMKERKVEVVAAPAVRLYINSASAYLGQFSLVKDVTDIKENETCIFILDNIEIHDTQLELLIQNFSLTKSDIMSPTIINSENKLIYAGGIMLNNKLQFINEEIFQHRQRSKDDCCKNTSILYPSLFITNQKELIKNYSNSTDVLKTFDTIFHKNLTIKVSPYAIFKENTSDAAKTYPYNPTHIPSFTFEKDFLNYWLTSQSTYNLQSLKMQKYPYLDTNSHPYILICENEILTPDRDCGSRYMFHFIELMISLKFNVHYCCAGNFLYNEHYVSQLQSLGVYVITGYPYCLHEYLKNNANVYTYVFISRLELFTKIYPCVKQYSPNSKCIFITHDLLHLRNETTNIGHIELKAIHDSDLSLIVSSYEYEYLQKKKISNIYYYPICYPNKTDVYIDSNSKHDICFVGSMHAPNIDAIVFFLENIFIKIIAIQNIKLYVIGLCCSVLSKYVNIFPNNLILCGQLDDNNYSKMLSTIRLNIAPLLTGAGIKGKILDPLNRGVPTLASKKGLEGMQMSHLETIIQLDYKDNYGKYAEEFISYYNNTALLDQIAINGKQHFKKWFSMEKSIIYFNEMFQRLSDLSPRIKDTNRRKIAIIYQYMYASSDDIINFIRFFEPYSHMFNFTYILINNGDSNINTNTESIVYLQGTNRLHEFSAYQEGIDYINTTSDDYKAFLLCNETMSKHFPIFLDKFVEETFDIVCTSHISCGIIDNFDFSFQVGNNMIDRWIRSNCLLINAQVMRAIDYKILSFESIKELPTLSENVNEKLITFLSHPRYSSLNPAMMQMKRINILNEYMLSHKLMKYGDIIHLKDIKEYAYNFFDPAFSLSFDKVPLGDRWIDIDTFRSYQEKIFSSE